MGVAVLTQTKGGLMFDVSLGGQKFTFEPRYVVLLMYTVTFKEGLINSPRISLVVQID
jgi:hypothetical protein